MKKNFYKDYAKASEFFQTDEKSLEQEIKNVEKSKKYIIWVQEFSKKIVVVTFLLYLATSIFSALLVYWSFKAGMISGIDTLITETNNTFRDVIGGYIIKSAIENAVKIGGNYFVGISDAKLKILQSKIREEHPDANIEEVSNDDEYMN